MTDNEVKHNVTKHGQPKALYMLFMVEMWERFNYYGMRALLSLFMISTVIGFTKATSSKIYGMFTALVYLTPSWADTWRIVISANATLLPLVLF